MSLQERISTARKPAAWEHGLAWCRERFQRLAEYADDHVNPIVLKELRQAVRGRFLGLMLAIFLAGQLLLLGVTLMRPEVRETAWAAANAGKSYFKLLLLLLLAICLLFIPVYTAVRLGLERSEQNMDLIFISTLSPRSIIVGKFFASVLFTILLFSAAAPFMAVSYLLRGIDFPTIFLLMTFAFGIVVLSTQLGLFSACVTVNRFFRFVVATFFLGALAGMFLMVMELVNASLRQGLGSAMVTGRFWVQANVLMTFGLFLFVLLFQMTVAMVSPASRNRAFLVRVTYTIGWALSGLSMFITGFFQESHEPLIFWVGFHSLLLAAGCFVVVVERDLLGPRLVREVPRPWLLRILAFPHFSGIANGLFWCASMLMATVALPAAWFALNDNPSWKMIDQSRDALTALSGIGLFGFAYAATGLLVHRALLSQLLSRHRVWVVGLGIFALCGFSPLLINLLTLQPQVPDTWMILTPFALFRQSTRDAAAVVALIWAGVAFLGVLPIVLHQFLEFRPPLLRSGGASLRDRQGRLPSQGAGPRGRSDAAKPSGSEAP